MLGAVTPELAEIRDFLAAHPPFDALPAPVLDRLPAALEVTYVRRGHTIKDIGQDNDELFVVRSGAVDVHDESGVLIGRRGAGEDVGRSTLVLGGPLAHRFTAIEDSLLLVMPGDTFRALAEAHPAFRLHYVEQEAARLQQAVRSVRASRHGGAVLTRRAGELVTRAPVTVRPDVTVRDAAATMRDERVSCLLVEDGGGIRGILTDRDLRTRVVADGRSYDVPVSEVMTADPWTVAPDTLAFSLMLEMATRGVHHVPVVGAGRPVGVVTTTDLTRLQQSDPVYLVGDIAKARDVDGVVAASRRTPAVVEGLVDQDASADDIGRMVSAIGDAVESRLLTLAELDLGAAPTSYAWVALGSRGRREQGLASDQDHCLVLAAPAQDEAAAWFAALAERVTAGLEACGYPRCAGDVMATNPRWRQPVSQWQDYFDTWTRRPSAQAVLDSAIFFDHRVVHGEPALLESVAAHARQRARTSPVFLAHTAAAAAGGSVPLGFFRGFVLEKEGERRDTLDLKRASLTLVTTARLHALASGVDAVSTQDRLAAASAAGALSEGLAADLRDAFEFVSYVRWRHQVRRARAGQVPDNHLDPQELSAFERNTLRDAFEVVRAAQKAVAARYPVRTLA